MGVEALYLVLGGFQMLDEHCHCLVLSMRLQLFGDTRSFGRLLWLLLLRWCAAVHLLELRLYAVKSRDD